MLFPRLNSLWLRMAWPFVMFVVLGSTALMIWMRIAAQRESRAVFTALAESNAAFIKNARLPASEQMMVYLGRILNMRAFLRLSSGEMMPPPEDSLFSERVRLSRLTPADGPVRLGNAQEAIAATLDNGARLVLVRPVDPPFAFLSRPDAMVVLGVFCFFSLVLAWVISRGVVRPLHLLAARLPHIERDPEATLPGADRADEVGQLARAYLATRAQLAEEREQRQKAERLALLGRMATGLAHEIHNPLAAIRMHAQLLQSAQGAEVPAAVEESAPVLLDESGRIESIVNQWMFLARPEPPRTAPVSLTDLVERAIRNHAALARHARVQVTADLADALAVQGDARRLMQAVANVMQNAFQAMPRGGELTIAARRADGMAELSFRDTGGGFSSEALAKYRDLFFSEKEGGMGIGLSVTAEILQAHGGKLEAGNHPAGGAVVTFHLPLLAS